MVWRFWRWWFTNSCVNKCLRLLQLLTSKCLRLEQLTIFIGLNLKRTFKSGNPSRYKLFNEATQSSMHHKCSTPLHFDMVHTFKSVAIFKDGETSSRQVGRLHSIISNSWILVGSISWQSSLSSLPWFNSHLHKATSLPREFLGRGTPSHCWKFSTSLPGELPGGQTPPHISK